MASRYWVGGNGVWSTTPATKWALTSGGAGGQPVPTASDDVFFDAASGAAAVTMSVSQPCKNLDCTGFTGSIIASSSAVRINTGSASEIRKFILSPTGTYTLYPILNSSQGWQIGTGGGIMTGNLEMAVSPYISLVSDFRITGLLTGPITAVNTNNYALQFGDLDSYCLNWNVGSSIITMTGVNADLRSPLVWNSSAGSEIRFTNTVSSYRRWLSNQNAANRTWDFGQTVYVVTPGASGSFWETDGNQPNLRIRLASVPSVPFALHFNTDQTYTIQSWDVTGAPGALVTIQTQVGTGTGRAYFVKSSGIVQSNYIIVKENWASGGAQFVAGANSTIDASANGWTLLPVSAAQSRAIIMA
jgi:hypothetical protein